MALFLLLCLSFLLLKGLVSTLVPEVKLAQNLFQDEGWVCKFDPATGTCGEVSMETSPESIRAMAIRFFGVKHGSCRSHGYCKFVRKEDVDCGLLGTRTANIYRERLYVAANAMGAYRTLVNRSLQRAIHGSDSHPGRAFVI